MCAGKAVAWSIYDFWGKIKNILFVACEVPGEGFRDLKEAYIQELFKSDAAEYTEEFFLFVFTIPEVFTKLNIISQFQSNTPFVCLTEID